MTTAADNPFRVIISEDRLRAELVLTSKEARALTPAAVVAKLKKLGVPVMDEVRQRVKVALRAARGGTPGEGTMLLAEGHPPQDAVPADFELAPTEKGPAEDEDVDARIDLRQWQIIVVNTGDVLGTWTPEIPAVAGVDVFGKPIPSREVPPSWQLGENVKLAENGQTVIAAATGKVHLARRTVSVVDVIEVKRDVDYSSGNVASPTSVVVGGTVRETFRVKAANCIAVRGGIEAAIVEAGGDVQVNGKISARHEGLVSAGGSIFAKSCEEAHLRAGGDISLTREAIHSTLYAAGRLSVPRGSVIGGYAYAREGAEVMDLGNEASVRTEIALGVDPLVLAEAAGMDDVIKKKRETVAKIREKVEPLMAQLKRLTPQQRKRATELMREADALDAEVAEHEKEKAAAMAAKSPASGDEVSLEVTGRMHPGVVVVFGDKTASIEEERQGPLKIVRRPVNRVEEIVMIDPISGDTHTLPSYPYHPETPPGPAPG